MTFVEFCQNGDNRRMSTYKIDNVQWQKLYAFLQSQPRAYAGQEETCRRLVEAVHWIAANIQVSMDGRGRALDNVFCERLWRSVKYENIYLQQYDSVRQLQAGLSDYFDFTTMVG